MKQFIESVRLVRRSSCRQLLRSFPRLLVTPERSGQPSAPGSACSRAPRLPRPSRAQARLPARPQGFEPVSDVAGSLAKVRTADAWDGGEGQAEAADEFDLADLMGDDEGGKKEEL